MFGLKNKINGGDPRTHRQETGGAWGSYTKKKMSGLASGLIEGTRVATAMGWRPVEAICEGDMVLTFDRGLQPIRAITKGTLWDGKSDCPKSLWPLWVPAGALGNRENITLLPEQTVMVESDTADMLFGDPFSLVPAADLVGFRGIERIQPQPDLEVIQLHFDDDEVVFAGAGALILCHSLHVINMEELLQARPAAARYDVLPHDEAQMLVDCLIDEDRMSRCWTVGQEKRFFAAA